jgi:hypothetical protein
MTSVDDGFNRQINPCKDVWRRWKLTTNVEALAVVKLAVDVACVLVYDGDFRVVLQLPAAHKVSALSAFRVVVHAQQVGRWCDDESVGKKAKAPAECYISKDGGQLRQ